VFPPPPAIPHPQPPALILDLLFSGLVGRPLEKEKIIQINVVNSRIFDILLEIIFFYLSVLGDYIKYI